MTMYHEPNELHRVAERLYPIPRSLTGEYTRETLFWLRHALPDLQLHSIPSGTPVYDWVVPPEWNVESAILEGPDGLVCSWEDNPLHLVGYSVPTECTVSKAELEKHLYSSHTRPAAIAYVASYYERRWGFCISENQRRKLPDGDYRVSIDTTLQPGRLDYADLVVPGRTREEVLFSTYICHPNLANDNVSGMVVQTALAQWIASAPRRYTYRFVFCPETIGALVYLSEHLEHLQSKVVAGFVLNCMGDRRGYSVVPSRTGGTLADRVGALSVDSPYTNGRHGTVYTWMQRGSDERQYASPLADLPVVRLSRSEHNHFLEYHTSDDDLGVISGEGLAESLEWLKDVVRILEADGRYLAKHVGDAQLGRRGLYPTLGHGRRDKTYQHVLSLCDGKHDLPDICNKTGLPPERVIDALETLQEHGLIGRVRDIKGAA